MTTNFFCINFLKYSTDFDLDNDYIEFYPMIGINKEKGKKYEPTVKSVKYKINEYIEEKWILKNPPNSFMSLRILLFYDNKIESSHNDLSKIGSVNYSNNETDDSNLLNIMNNCKLDLNYKNSKLSNEISTPNRNNKLDDIKITNDIKSAEKFQNPATTTRLHREKDQIISITKDINNKNMNSPIKLETSLPKNLEKKLPISNCDTQHSHNLLLPPRQSNLNKSNEHKNQNSLSYTAISIFSHPHNSNTANNDLRISTQESVQNIQFQNNQTNNNLMPSNLKILDSVEMFVEQRTDDIISDSFCDAFFGVSLPTNDSKIINESEKLTAPCGHSDCSILDAYKPDITFRYPDNDDLKIEINSLVYIYL